MKIRHGHVSNSSTSSFVVAYDSWMNRDNNKEPLLSPEQVEVLKSLGFIRSWTSCPEQVEILGMCEIESKAADDGCNFIYSHICNHDEIFKPLIEARIPFTGMCHYGHWNTFYDGVSEYVLFVRNLGMQIMPRPTLEEMEKELIHSIQQPVIRKESIYDYVPEPEEI